MSDFTITNGVQYYKGTLVMPMAFTNFDGTEPQKFGTDPGGNPTFFTIISANETIAGAFKNETTVPQTMTYTASTGSEIGFQQSAGITVEVTGGIALGPLTFGSNVSATATLGFSQAFSKSVSHSVAATVSAGKTGVVYEAVLLVQYLSLLPIYTQGSIAFYAWAPKQKDIINTGSYILREH
ncbi:MAG: hypothetical protein ACRC6I_16680 [Paracoccaceae bacterium]